MKHLNSKTVLGLGISAALAVVAALIITSARKPVLETSARAAYLIPELRDHVNDVDAVIVTGAENKPLVTVEKTASSWVVKESGGYPADLGKVRELLLKLADAALLEQKTANEQHYADLGVADLGGKDAKGVLLTLQGLDKPVQLIIGNSSTRGDGTFVRHAGEKQSWLAKGALTVDKEPSNWLDKALADIPAARIREVMLRRPDGKMLRAVKQPGDAHLKLAEIPKGREPSSDFVADSLGSVLSGLRLDDVYPAARAEPSADTKLYRARFVTFEGLSVDLTAWKQGDKNYARLDAALDTTLVDNYIQSEQARTKAEFEERQQKPDEKNAPKQAEPPPLAVSDPAKDRQQRLDALNSELARLKQRFTNWTFALPAYRFSSLDKSLEDLLKPVEPGKTGGKRPAAKK